MPDYRCKDYSQLTLQRPAVAIGDGKSFYYATQSDFDIVFKYLDKDMMYTLVDYNHAYFTEMHYFCIDQRRAVSLITKLSEMSPSLKVSAVLLSFLSVANDFVSMINLLNVSLRFEGVMVTSPAVLDAAAETWVSTSAKKVPGYTFEADMSKLDKTGC